MTALFPRRSIALWLLAIVAVVVALATVRVQTVPILQCPDEDSHLDYALGIYSNGGLLRASESPTSGWHRPYVAVYYDWERISHILTLHLTEAVDMHNVRVSEANKVAPKYGASSFFESIDASAPSGPANVEVGPEDNPWLMGAYPFGYYALVAVVMKIVSIFTDSVTALFFAGRAVSVILLAGSVPLFYGILRQLKFEPQLSLMAAAGFGLFPVVQYAASCIQPDNLGLFAVLLTTFTGLKVTADPRARWLAALAFALGLLAVTKYQFFLFGALPVLLMLWARRLLGPVRTVLVLIPAVLTFGIHLWVAWGAPKLVDLSVGRSSNLLQSGLAAIWNFWLGGYAFQSFWSSSYGYPSIPLPVRWLLIAATVAGVAGLMWWVATTAQEALGQWRAGKRTQAGVVLTNNPLLMGLVLFTGFMVALYAYSDNGFYAQGRHWLPFVPAMIAFAALYFPAMAPTEWRRRLTRYALAALLVVCVAGVVHGLITMTVRYYPIIPAAAFPAIFNPTSAL